MASDNYGLKDDWAQGQLITANALNDVHETIDNQLGELSNLLGPPDGTISGWTIAALAGNLNVAAGEGWVGGAHCETTAPQAITGITANDTNFIYAVRKTALSGRVSTSFTIGEVDFVANITGVPPGNSLLIATGVVNVGGTEFSSVENTPDNEVYLHGPVSLGDGVNGSIAGQLNAQTLVYTTNATLDTEDSVSHGLSRVPVGFLVIRRDKAGIVYDSGGVWSKTVIKLKCNVASVTVTILVF